MKRLGHRPELDGARGIAILLVMLAHARVPGFYSGGVTGVTLFFVLSGFLITTLLVEEHARTGAVSLCAFYRRRALRLLPALFALVVVAIAYEIVIEHNPRYLPNALLPVLYVANIVRESGRDFWPLGHTWSLAIEEQFYLIWPLVLILARRRRVLLAFALVGAGASIAARFLLWHGDSSSDRVYYGTDTRADALMLGCALALWLTRSRRVPAIALPVAVTLFVLGTNTAAPYSRFVLAPTAAAVGGALLIAYLTTTETRGRIFRWSPFRVTGRISYGLYLWNVPVVGVLGPRFALLSLPITYLIAAASYRWVELPFLRRKHQLPAHHETEAGAAVAAVPGSPTRARRAAAAAATTVGATSAAVAADA